MTATICLRELCIHTFDLSTLDGIESFACLLISMESPEFHPAPQPPGSLEIHDRSGAFRIFVER